ncbi:preprotein translocase, SecE subunit [Gleimia coleocanis DSM 15436]|uniref:Protein translocase subunit SecE n=1 Tax=Gleimia coleocanis DSM 15436 TaxID=525245 RepID=C0VYZ5_9ACTO|nr:preprotein translocase subunit SecE [Gleimia coleocanis]EEH64648.1 preprotein translocase, SecE subunit [Gleimia coleocanis DSM 15436]
MAGKVKKQQETESFFARIVLFVKQVIGELKKVVWPTVDEWKTYFLVVLVFVGAIMAFTGLLDLLFSWLSVLVFG